MLMPVNTKIVAIFIFKLFRMNLLNRRHGTLLLILSLIISSKLHAQETGFLIFSGVTKHAEKGQKIAGIKVVAAKSLSNETVKETTTDKKGEFEFNLPFGEDYKITFSHPDAVTAYIIVYASQVPKEMYSILPPRYETDVLLKWMNDKGTAKYKCPYSKVLFEKKRKGFIEDLNHRNMFINSTIICDEMIEKKVQPVVTNTVQPVENAKKITIGGKFLIGENPSIPLTNTIVYLVNDDNKILETTSTNILGAFVFTGFMYEKNNVLRVVTTDVDVTGKKIFLIGKEGKTVQTTDANEKGGFEFKIIMGDKNTISLLEMDDSQLKRDLIGKLLADDKPVVNSKLNLKNDAGELIQSAITDVNGKFIFADVAAKQIIVIAIDASANIKTGSKVVIADEQGKPQKQLTYKPGESFEFKMLPHEQTELSRFYADDPWLKVVNLKPGTQKNNNLVITENVYFNAGEYALLPDAQKVLDKVISIMNQVPDIKIELGAHTDSKGGDQLNMELSKKRADAAVAYMVAKNINSKRLMAIGYGETKPVNKCKNNVECSEEEHAQNRRIEFKILK